MSAIQKFQDIARRKPKSTDRRTTPKVGICVPFAAWSWTPCGGSLKSGVGGARNEGYLSPRVHQEIAAGPAVADEKA